MLFFRPDMVCHPILAVSVLEVLGIVALVVMSVLTLGVLYIIYKIWQFKRAMRQLGNALGDMGEAFKQGIVPSTLGLTPAEDDALDDAPDAVAAIKALEARGFLQGGCYGTRLSPDVVVATLADPTRGVTAAIAKSGPHGVTIDIVTQYQDGEWLTHRTLKSLGMDYPPHCKHVAIPGASADVLLDRHLADRPDKPYVEVEPEDVATMMETFNAEVVKWRDNRGGLTEQEVRRNLAITGTKADDDTVNFLLAMSKVEAEKRRGQNDDRDGDEDRDENSNEDTDENRDENIDPNGDEDRDQKRDEKK
jgi:hypothetical protein